MFPAPAGNFSFAKRGEFLQKNVDKVIQLWYNILNLKKEGNKRESHKRTN